MIKAYPAKVVWHDAAGGTTGWQNEEDSISYRPYIVESYGWLIRQDKTCVVLAVSRHPHRGGPGQSFADTLEIPRKVVQSIKRLRG